MDLSSMVATHVTMHTNLLNRTSWTFRPKSSGRIDRKSDLNIGPEEGARRGVSVPHTRADNEHFGINYWRLMDGGSPPWWAILTTNVRSSTVLEDDE
ncbi:hypothetical protein CEXT_143451 [Caerostris extrusa]|uniref:Uncharacterized protein n=1 Tax=Caerostris extrusa TaxID=172846 RepID=A0AAV4XRL8_CAEEX|nr:hypothetical protein CEXT_143451 [Caerostris extrusa]